MVSKRGGPAANVRGKQPKRDWGGIAYFLSLYFVIPLLLGKVALGASWRAVCLAYAIWLALLFLWGMTNKGTLQERIGWPIIMGMFFTIPAIPAGVLLLRELAGIR